MKEYECCWCSMETNDEETGVIIIDKDDALCPRCALDPTIHAYTMTPEQMVNIKNPCAEIKEPKPVCPVIDIQKFGDVLDALRITYSGHGVGIKGDHKLLRLFLDMSECVDNT